MYSFCVVDSLEAFPVSVQVVGVNPHIAGLTATIRINDEDAVN